MSHELKSRATAAGGINASPVSVRKPPSFRGRRSWVRIPSAALGRPVFCRCFLLRQSACSSASGRTDSGLAVRRSSAASRKTPGLQADSRSSELKSFCRPAEARVFCRPRPIAGFLQTAPLACGCQPTRWQRSRSAGGESDFSPETARPTSAAPRRGQPIAPRPVSSLRRAASETEARCPSRAAWAVAIARVHRGGCPFHRKRASARNRRPPHRPKTGVCDCRPIRFRCRTHAGGGRRCQSSVMTTLPLARPCST
jgi:hypothetical protein